MTFIITHSFQGIVTYLMANLQLQNMLCLNVSTCVTPLQSSGFSEKRGVTWMHTRESLYPWLCHLLLIYVKSSKGLNAVQTAFAVKKYKSHHQVGLPSEIIALMQA